MVVVTVPLLSGCGMMADAGGGSNSPAAANAGAPGGGGTGGPGGPGAGISGNETSLLMMVVAVDRHCGQRIVGSAQL